MPDYFIRFDLRGGDEALMEMQARFACRHRMGLEVGIRSRRDLETLKNFLAGLPRAPEVSIHLRRGKEFDFYFSDDDPGRNRHSIEAAVALLDLLPGTAVIVHDETDPHAGTLSASRLEAYAGACRAIDPHLRRHGKILYVEFSGRLVPRDYIGLMEAVRATGAESVGACVDTGHLYYYFRKKVRQRRGKAVESMSRFIGEVRATGVPVAYHVHDCTPESPHPRSHVSDHRPVGEGEIGLGGFRRIAGYLAGERVTLEILPFPDPGRTVLTDEEVTLLTGYAAAHGTDEGRELRDGRIMKRTLEAMAESRRVLDALIASV
ncbi:sugar phosphate isomerase/epimerase [Methanofollis formosanus]|uniref:Sugar phosphate isomerase/epimerase n=1 Tax=Methanofollis formosanus TaxID=299308 RepID=A0A8G0ZZ43_9EURY|nr:TIM barrel protein [Methanofollis formosanus]QYZ78397.1 sugar phosphate isomerase/epimerase [Methanofollis formosanus]